jgi:ectoine hydroxylase-related dioxygenase (phytanoyl-CoA dioxygenase family)
VAPRLTLPERAARDGYVLERGVLDVECVLALRRRVLDVCARFGWVAAGSDVVAHRGVRLGAYDEQWVALQQEISLLPEFAALGREPAIFRTLEEILQAPVRGGVGSVCRVTSPAGRDLATPPHQDRHFIGGETFWTVWIPLGDCPRELGGLDVLPGSHRDGLREHGPDDAVDVPGEGVWLGADYLCGDALFFHCLTLHRARPNETRDRVRLSADFRYRAATVSPNGGASSTLVPLTTPPTTGPTGT